MNNLETTHPFIRQYLKIFDTQTLLIKTDKNGIITYLSVAYLQTLNIKKENFLNKEISHLHLHVKNSSIKKILNSIRKNKENWEGEINYTKEDGEPLWMHLLITPIYENDGTIVEFCFLLTDITVQKNLEKLSHYDSLTGVHNRRYYNTIIPKEINRLKRDKKYISFAMIDIDFFKQYNDIYGHIHGDKALTEVANYIQNSLKRASDYCFRMGGEEFCIVFSDYDTSKSFKFCENLRIGIEKLQIAHSGSSISKYLTISIGLVVSNLASEIIDDLGLYSTADNALYRAKANGRNQTHLHISSEINLF